MMQVQAIWGWGGIRFVYGETDVVFSTAFTGMILSPEYIRNRTLQGRYIDHFQGWRVNIKAKIFNYDPGDAVKIVTLLNILSESMASDTPVLIYPRYTAGDTGSQFNIMCKLDSDLDFPDIVERVSVGQTADLDFTGRELIDVIPTNISDVVVTRLAWSPVAGNVLIYDSTVPNTHIITGG